MIKSSGILTSTSTTSTTTAPERVSPLRQGFIEHLILQQKAPRTVQSYTSWIRDLAKFHHRSPDQLGQPEIRGWILHLIAERKLSASSVIRSARTSAIIPISTVCLVTGVGLRNRDPPQCRGQTKAAQPHALSKKASAPRARGAGERGSVLDCGGGAAAFARRVETRAVSGTPVRRTKAAASRTQSKTASVRLGELTLEGSEFVRRLSLHILPPGFTKIRHYGILGNNRRTHDVAQARLALEAFAWRIESSPGKPAPAPPAEPATCPRCHSEELVCAGRLEASGRLLPLQPGARRLRFFAGEPPQVWTVHNISYTGGASPQLRPTAK